jgi:hypothetical protein
MSYNQMCHGCAKKLANVPYRVDGKKAVIFCSRKCFREYYGILTWKEQRLKKELEEKETGRNSTVLPKVAESCESCPRYQELWISHQQSTVSVISLRTVLPATVSR